MKVAKQMILHSHYAEFPEMIATLELCRAFARLDRRSVSLALRECSSMLAEKASNKNLRSTLQVMSNSAFPETQIVYLKNCMQKMTSALSKEFRDVVDVKYPGERNEQIR